MQASWLNLVSTFCWSCAFWGLKKSDNVLRMFGGKVEHTIVEHSDAE